MHDRLGKEGDFSNSIILFTSNIGSDWIIEKFGKKEMPQPNDLMEIIVLAFDMTIMILGDMVQQNECAGTAGHQSHTSCRSCLIMTTEKQDLLYDTLTNGHY